VISTTTFGGQTLKKFPMINIMSFCTFVENNLATFFAQTHETSAKD
jgi:hypothetical protein